MRDKEIDRIYNNTFFKLMRKHNFVKFYFPKFKLVELDKGDYLYQEGDKIDCIYFTKEGNFNVYLKNKNILKK